MYATSRPRTSRYHSIAFRGSETTIAIVSTPRTVMRVGMESEVRAMNLSVSGRRASALRRPASVHLRVPLHDLVVGDPVDLLLHRELVLRLPGLHDPPGGGFALELRDEEFPLSATRLERRDHLGAVEDDVAGPHVELVDNRFAQVEEQVVQRREHELPTEFRLLDLLEAVLHRPHHGSLPAGEEAFHQPSLGLELPQSQARLPHVVLETRVRGKRLRRCHAEAADDPPQNFAAGVVPADPQVGDRTIAIVRVPSHVEPLVQLPQGRRRGGPAEVRKDQEPLSRNRSFLLDDSEDGFHVLCEARRLRGFVQAEIRFRAVRPVLRNREAFRVQPTAVKPLQRTELLHAEARREIGAQAPEGFCRRDRIGETGVEGDPLPRQREGEEILRLEVPRHDGTVGQEIGESNEAGPGPVGKVFRLRDVLRLESRDSQDVDTAHRVELHHAREGRNRLVQLIRRGEIHLADLDASAHLPDLRHADEVAILDEGEEPAVPVAARDLGPERLRPRIEQGQDPHGIRTQLPGNLSERREVRRQDVHLRLRLPRHEDPHDDSILLEPVHQPFELVPLEPRPFANPGERHGTVRREEAPHDRLESVRHLRMRRIERHVQIAGGPPVPLEPTDHVDIVVEFVEALFHLFPSRPDLRCDRPKVRPVAFTNHIEDLRLEFRERAPGKGGQEQGHVLRTDVPHTAVQEAALEDVAGLPPAQPLIVVEPRRVIVDVEDHAGLEEPIEVFVEGVDARKLLLEQEGLHLVLVEDLARLVFPLEALEVPRHHELEFFVDEEVAGRGDALGLEVPQDFLDELGLQAQCDRELLRAVRAVDLEPLRENLVQRLLEVRPLRFAREIDRLLDATPADEVRALEFAQRLVQIVFPQFRETSEVLVGPRLLFDEFERFLFWRLESGPLGIDRDVGRQLVLRRPVDALRGPHAVDEALVHELPRPLPQVGEGRGRDLEDRSVLLLAEVRIPDAIQIGQDVFLPSDLRQLSPEVLRNLARLELNRADLVRRHDAFEDLTVEFAQQRRPVLHEDEVGDPLEHDVVGERGREAGEVALDDRDLPRLDPPQDLPGVIQVHDHVQDLVVGLLDHREVLDLVEPIEHALGPQLLPANRDLAALVVAEDHERPRRTVAEALLEQLRVANRTSKEVLEVLARDEFREAFELDAPRDRDHEVVVRHAHADVRVVGLCDGEREGAAQRVVHPTPEREVEDDVPVPLDVEVPLEENLAVRGQGRDQRLLLLDVRNEGLSRARVDVVLLHQPLLSGLLPVLGDLSGKFPAELAARDREVERTRQHLARPRGHRRPTAGRVLHVHRRAAGADELVRAPAQDEDVARAQVLDELLAQLAQRRSSFREDMVRPFLRDCPDVRVVDHPGAFLLPDSTFFLIEPYLGEDLDVRVPRREVVEDCEEVFLRQVVEAVRPPDQLERLIDVPPFLKGHRDERLGEDIEGIARDVHPVDPGVIRGFREGRALHEVPRLERDHPADRGLAVRMARAADPLQSFRDGLGGTNLDDEVDVTDVDSQFQGSRGDGRLQLTVFQLLLHLEAGDL